MQARDLEVLEDLKGTCGTWDQSTNPPLRRQRCSESDQSSGHLLSRTTIGVICVSGYRLCSALWQISEWVYRISVLGLEGGRNSIYPHRAIALSSAYPSSQFRPLLSSQLTAQPSWLPAPPLRSVPIHTASKVLFPKRNLATCTLNSFGISLL